MDYSKLETMSVTPGEDGVYHVELIRERSRNAVNMQMWLECRAVFEHLAANGDCIAIVLSARGKSFCAGIDLQDPSNMPPHNDDVARKGLNFISHVKPMQQGLTAIEECLKPTIVAIHGACVGAGVDLITATDVRLCSEDAFFCVKEVAVGLAADVGTLARLPKVVGSDSWVRELALTARNCSAEEAKLRGLVSDVHKTKEETVAAAMKMASLIASHSPIAVLGTKKNLNFSRDHSVGDSLDYVVTWNASMIQTEDMAKAMSASMQKKKATFSKL
jgi:delta(3,5)-delta(2,4)-dienoyl-CoA isomerase